MRLLYQKTSFRGFLCCCFPENQCGADRERSQHACNKRKGHSCMICKQTEYSIPTSCLNWLWFAAAATCYRDFNSRTGDFSLQQSGHSLSEQHWRPGTVMSGDSVCLSEQRLSKPTLIVITKSRYRNVCKQASTVRLYIYIYYVYLYLFKYVYSIIYAICDNSIHNTYWSYYIYIYTFYII